MSADDETTEALAKITQLAQERQDAWDRAHALSMDLYEAIEASGISPTRIAAAAPISRVAIYSLKRQMEARIARQSGKGD